MEIWAEGILFLAVGLLFHTYVGYPVALWIAGRVVRPRTMVHGTPIRWPTVSVIISAYNESAVIGQRIRNLLDQDYPKDALQIVIGSDGSTDGMCQEIVRRYPRVTCLAFGTRRGKASVLNDLVAHATGEYLIFTDAATVFASDTVRQLIGGFWCYPTAAVIGGRLDIHSTDTGRNQDGLYWRYEMFLKTMESRIGAALGVSGAIYAIRRKDYQPLPAQTMADDLLQPMLIRLRTGGDVVLHHLARASQVTPKRVADEFHRRVRTGAGMVHVMLKTWRLLLPTWGRVAGAYWSHKVLRVAGPWLLLAALAANISLLHLPVYRLLFVLQMTGYGVALSAGWLTKLPALGFAARSARYFLVLNVAVAVGTVKFAMGMAQPAWNRTLRPVPAGPALPVADGPYPEGGHAQRPAA